MIFQLMKLGTHVIPHFHVILTESPISDIISIIRGHLQGEKVDLRVKWEKITFLAHPAEGQMSF